MKKLTFVGAGSMAEAMISGMLKSNLIEKNGIWVTNRKDDDKLIRMNREYGVNTSYDLEKLFSNADAVILAMKPKDAAAAITRIKEYLTEDMLIISVLAGISISSIEELSGKSLAIVRAMPNTSAAIRKSATAIAVNKKVTDHQKKIVKQMFETIGLTTFVEEEQLDAVTGLSGSGPAYIYYLVEAMEKVLLKLVLKNKLQNN